MLTTFNRRIMLASLAGTTLLGATSARAAQGDAIPIGAPVLTPPRIVGPIPATATSVPYATSMTPGSYTEGLMRQYDYVEEEYFLSGHANIYGPGIVGGRENNIVGAEALRPLGGLVRAGMPYSTRLLLVRPRDNEKFSGRVLAYMFHNLTANMMVEPNFLRNGDVIVGVEGNTGARYTALETPRGGIAQLHDFNLDRYRDLFLTHADPLPWPDLRPGRLATAYNDFSVTDPNNVSAGVFLQEMSRAYAQAPDIMTQVAHALKLNNPALPFQGKVRHLFNYGASGGSTFLTRYIDYHHNNAVLPDGRQAYDGYLVAVGNLPKSRPNGAVLAFLESEGDLVTNLVMNRDMPADTDNPRFRLYQLPGTGHLISAPLDPAAAARANAQPYPDGWRPYDKMNKPIVWGIWQNMFDWIEHGRPMPRAPRIVLNSRAADGIARDTHGNARGGLRTPWLDVPDGVYTGRVSREMALQAGIRPFSEEELARLYGSRANYTQRVNRRIDRMARDRWIMAQDAELMRVRT